jgi:predicted amidohydrolase
MTSKFTAAAVAMHVIHDKAANLEHYHEYIRQAASSGARLVVFPEGSLQGFLFEFNRGFDADESRYHWENAEPVPGPSTSTIEEWARTHNMYVVFGLMERNEDTSVPRLHNTAALVGPQGYIGKYRKVHRPVEEQIYYQPGNSWPVFETELGNVGMMICYDQNFPEAARELTLGGAELLIIPSAWSVIDDNSSSRYALFGQARAAENNRWVIQSNQVGASDKSSFNYIGCSRIIDPDGSVVAQTPANEPGMVVAEIKPMRFDPARGHTRWYLLHRKPESYTHLTKSSPDSAEGRNK